jgi:hypothetical protein
MSFLKVYIYFIALSFIISLFTYKDSKHSYLKFFPPFLFATLVAESVASYLTSINKNNLYIYNVFTAFEFCFYIFFISNVISNKKAKTVIRLSCAVYLLISIINIFFIQGLFTFHTITYCLGCLIIVALCIYYFLELFRSPKSIKLSVEPAFWICSGLLFFYCCGFPLYAFANFWVKFRFVIENIEAFLTILNIFLYSLFTIAFLCSRTRNYISSPL